MYEVYWYYDNDEQTVFEDTFQSGSEYSAGRYCQETYGDKNVDFEDVVIIRAECLGD